ncbi:MAG: hypothetical protein JXB62_16805 [Pirellulales bacterium]|nr:hypothetical protein [Pirellulales bacterium]
MADTNHPNPSPFQFSLRSLLLLMVPLALLFGWIGCKMQRARRHADFAQKLKPCEPFITWEGDKLVSIRFDEAAPSRLTGIAARPGWQHFPTDDHLALLKSHVRLRILSVWYGPRVTDAGVACLKDLTELECLRLRDVAITDDGLAYLENMHRLSYLDLTGANITDAGLAHLARLEGLRELILEDTEISDTGLEHLKNLRSLSRVNAAGTQVTQKGCRALAPDIAVYYSLLYRRRLRSRSQ